MTVEQVTDAIAYHGEGPVWSPTWGGLRWVDMLAGDLLTLHDDGRVDRLHVGKVAAFHRPRAGGGYVVATERGLALSSTPHDAPTPWAELWSDEGVRMNDGGCDPWGNLYAGSMAYDAAAGAASFYRVTPDGQVLVVLDDATISNGFEFSPDESLAYYNDTPTNRTDVFDVVDQHLTNRRTFRDWGDQHPDGLTVDSAGNVWVAVHGAGRVVCVAPDGSVLTEIEVPAAQTTACALGGEDLRDLYITTSRENLDDPEPGAGALFRVRVDVPGLPVRPFAG